MEEGQNTFCWRLMNQLNKNKQPLHFSSAKENQFLGGNSENLFLVLLLILF